MDSIPYTDEAVDLTASAEAVLKRAVERCGGYAIDRDVTVRCSAALNFLTDCEAVLEVTWASRIKA